MSLERPFFQSFVEDDGEAFDRYISEKRRDGSWGDEPEIQALCELYDRPCEVWAYDAGMDPRKGGGARCADFSCCREGWVGHAPQLLWGRPLRLAGEQ